MYHAKASNPPGSDRIKGPPSRLLTVLLMVVVAAVLTQAILAGLFISATAEARLVHLAIGSLLPCFAIARRWWPGPTARVSRRVS